MVYSSTTVVIVEEKLIVTILSHLHNKIVRNSLKAIRRREHIKKGKQQAETCL